MNLQYIAIVVPLACSFLTGCNSDNEVKGLVAANIFAIKEARKVQAAIAATHSCPKNLSGWKQQDNGDNLTTVAGIENARYELFFECSKNLAFSITVKTSLDSWVYVLGNAIGPLEIQYGHFTAPSTVKVSAEDEIVAIATKAAGE